MTNLYRIFRSVCVLLAAATLGGCAEEQKAAAPPPLTVQVTNVVQKDVPIYSEWIGQLEGSVNADIKPKVEGFLIRQLYVDGSVVQKGQTLFTLDARQMQAALEQSQADLAHAQAGLQKAKDDVIRFRPLVAQRAISQMELDNAVSAQQAAQASVDATQAALDNAKLNRNWTTVTSPITGIIGIAKVNVGDLIMPMTVMATVSTLNPIYVDFSITEQDYLKFVRSGMTERKVNKGQGLELILADGSVYPLRGRALLVNRAVDPTTGTLTVRGEFPNTKNFLRPGQYARIRAITEMRHDALLVPQRAVSELQGGYQVALVDPEGKVTIRQVTVGQQVGPYWVVNSGLNANDRVVVEGIQKVRDGAIVKTVPAKEFATGANSTSGD
jgi:membrane fusion protein (multidrug efflux system)